MRILNINTYRGYTLDSFQQEAIKYIRENKNIIVTAPTGAGKTLIAEYAIHQCLQNGKQVIYTSPLKALSNQKYRQFKRIFGRENVGILTGDVVLNEEASILIMTTEILRNMLFGDVSILDEVAYVIFDEFHYFSDHERGVTWEETIMLLPSHIKILALSATIPNVNELADWIQWVRNSEIKIVKTDNRPVPLKYYLYYGNKLEYVDIKALQQNNKLLDFIQDQTEAKSFSKKQFFSLVRTLVEKRLVPALYFVYRRKGCEELSSFLFQKKFNFINNLEERKRIKNKIKRLLDTIPRQDHGLEQVSKLLQYVEHGYAYHHAGLLPNLKEFVEDLFDEGLIKILFSTETFAMGMNNPTRTVVFHLPFKWDGRTYRLITPTEFQQMAGRAGRRGIDRVGHVILVLNQITKKEAIYLMTAKSNDLASQFKLSYSTVLNLLHKFPQDQIETFLNKSFSTYQEKLHKKEVVDELDQKIDTYDFLSSTLTYKCPYIGLNDPQYWKKTDAMLQETLNQETFLLTTNKKIKRMVRRLINELYEQVMKDLPLGSIVRLKNNIIGVVVEYNLTIEHILAQKPCLQILLENQITIPIYMNQIHMVLSNHVLPIDDLLRLTSSFKDFLSSLSNETITFKWKHWKEFRSLTLYEHIHKEIQKAKPRPATLKETSCTDCPYFDDHLQLLMWEEMKNSLIQEKRDHQRNHSVSERTFHFREMITLLKKLKYIDKNLNLLVKGKILRNIYDRNGILVTELLQLGILPRLSPEEILGVLSFFVVEPQYRRAPIKPKSRSVYRLFWRIKAIDESIKQLETRLNIPRTYRFRSYSFDYAEIVMRWARGLPLKEVLQGMPHSEGDVIKALRRLIDLLRQINSYPYLPLNIDHLINLIFRDQVIPSILKEDVEEESE